MKAEKAIKMKIKLREKRKVNLVHKTSKQPTTNNKQQTTNNKQQPTSNKQQISNSHKPWRH